MKKYIVIVFLSFFSLCQAQERKLSQIEVVYDWHHYHWLGEEYVHPMILLANSTESKFYNARTQFVDSLKSTPEGLKVWYQMVKADKEAWKATGKGLDLPSRAAPVYIFKSKGKPTEVYDGFMLHLHRYSEPEENIDWQLGDSTKLILNYECQMAEAYYHGRHWTAWFTPEIPIQNGPWKLGGLPGLILEASESTGQHSFTVREMEAVSKEMTPHYFPKAYQYYADRFEANREWRAWQDQLPYGAIDADGTPLINKYRRDLDFLDADYHEKSKVK